MSTSDMLSSCDREAVSVPSASGDRYIRVLIIDDQVDYARSVQAQLRAEGIGADLASDGIEGRDLALSGAFDLMLMSTALPGLDGLTMLREVGETACKPTIALSPDDSTEARVRALQAGADDCVARTIDLSELIARLRAVLRRPVPSAARHSGRITVGDLEIDTSACRVYRKGESLTLSAHEYRLLLTLFEHRGRVLSRAELIEAVWDTEGNAESNVVEVAISRIRSKVGDAHPPKLIHTVRGVGYQLDWRPG